ncbi:ribosomal protection-like ABC-F family protein [Streptomyces litchfieldiae]|uniref:ABC-F family ATP-binding cassette domain-containing protein n=1 Tax=Streptomyces litchfieldiae TaxID=3075543 RepID=A0ABU2MNE5_9ACTN|nr:ABC-F family ATP-binding cassette domain-containing protein [Streptomyces sp. DSM 44938]MDT0343147.1 ABC-F family ATP-binding cassette domain-containing protein [Streptomyces sp. DSM 44938]
MSAQLVLKDVTKSYAGRLVLDHISLTVAPGSRVGIVGENGSGKSTLLRLIAGAAAPDDGTVTVAAPGGIGHLGQTLDLPNDHTVRGALDTALAELRAMERRLRELEAVLAAGDPAGDVLVAYGDLLNAFEARGGYEADARADKALHALGLGGLPADRRLGDLSGGERARLGLACLLTSAPELMLLDEPTNHLDAAALTWLEDRLRAHRGTVVAVSHDRTFLERVTTAVVEVADGAVTRYGDGYAGFLAGHAAARQRWEQAYADWCGQIEEAERYAATTAHRVAPGRAMKDGNKMAYDRSGGRVQNSVAGRVRQARERLRRLRRDPVPKPPEPLRFGGGFGTAGAPKGTLAELTEVRVGDRLRIADFGIAAGERLLITGSNGAGKSTFLRLLAGELAPDSGTVRRRGRAGWLPQDPAPGDPARSLLAAFAAGRAGCEEEHRERLLSLGLFHAEALDTRVGELSVGQRQRLALARLLTEETDLLLLDEPTNHLSPALVEELERALEAYSGALVVVSHDRALCGRFAGGRLRLEKGEPVR